MDLKISEIAELYSVTRQRIHQLSDSFEHVKNTNPKKYTLASVINILGEPKKLYFGFGKNSKIEKNTISANVENTNFKIEKNTKLVEDLNNVLKDIDNLKNTVQKLVGEYYV